MSKEKTIFTVEIIDADSDIQGLQVCMAGMGLVSERMRQATIDFLQSKYVDDE